MLILALSLLQRPSWWLDRMAGLQDELRRFPVAWGRPIAPAPRPPYDRGMVRTVRLMGALLAAVSILGLYQAAVEMLIH